MSHALLRVLAFAPTPVAATLPGDVIATAAMSGLRRCGSLQQFALVASDAGAALGVGTHLAPQRVAARLDVRVAGTGRAAWPYRGDRDGRTVQPGAHRATQLPRRCGRNGVNVPCVPRQDPARPPILVRIMVGGGDAWGRQ